MANHVTTRVDISGFTEDARQKMVEAFERVRSSENSWGRGWFADVFVDGEELTFDMVEKYDWAVENIGAKWSYIEDMEYSEDSDVISFSIVSAWSYPEAGVIRFCEEFVAPYSENFIAQVIYEDEMPNFIGASVINVDGVYDNEEWDWDYIENAVIERAPELAEMKDEDGDFTDEGRDILWEHQWEVIRELQDDFIQGAIEGINYVDDEE